jgi:hypothetical protein
MNGLPVCGTRATAWWNSTGRQPDASSIDAFVAPGRVRHGENNSSGKRRRRRGSRIAAMALKLKRAGRCSRYRLRKQIVEPVFGQIKHARGFRQLLL